MCVPGWLRGKRTKIVCTIGPASASPGILAAMVRAGMDVARLNFSHGTREEHVRTSRLVRRIAERQGRPVAVLADLEGPRIRVGKVAEGTTLTPRTKVVLTTRDVEGDAATVPVSYDLGRDVRRGDAVLLADGSLELRVVGRGMRGLECRVRVGGPLASHKGVNVPSRTLSLPSLTRKDAVDLRFAVESGFDLLAQSFVQSARDVNNARRLSKAAGRVLPIIAKIERQGALDRLEEILDAADGIIVARGDLGVEIPLARVPRVQKRIIHAANARAKPVVTATQMLESMVTNPRPTRAEATDVYNAILDGTDAVMLSEESAVGRHPVESVRVLASIAQEAEAALTARPIDPDGADVKAAVAAAAVTLARDLQVAAIVAPTSTGRTPRAVSRHRPGPPILALSADAAVLRGLSLSWGVVPVAVRGRLDLKELAAKASALLRAEGVARRTPFVVTMGYPPGQGLTNMVLVLET